jgi:hypothetical protein
MGILPVILMGVYRCSVIVVTVCVILTVFFRMYKYISDINSMLAQSSERGGLCDEIRKVLSS